MSQPDEPDTAREVRPVVMFDDKERGAQEGIKDFRPISDYEERHKGKADHLGGDLEGLDGSEALTDDDEPEAPEYEETGGLATPEPAPERGGPEYPEDGPGMPPKQDGDDLPPEPAPEPEPEATGGSTDEDETEDDIPSPWDEPTSD